MSDSLKAKMGEFQQKWMRCKKKWNLCNAVCRSFSRKWRRNILISSILKKRGEAGLEKDRASETRQGLIEKRSHLLHSDGKPKTKVSEADLDKQLADFEQQIKAQEQIINQLNAEFVANHKEAEKAEEPYHEAEKEIEELSRKIDDLGAKIGLTSLSLIPRNYAMARRVSEPAAPFPQNEHPGWSSPHLRRRQPW